MHSPTRLVDRARRHCMEQFNRFGDDGDYDAFKVLTHLRFFALEYSEEIGFEILEPVE